MFKQSVTNFGKDNIRKRVKLRRGETTEFQQNQMKTSKVLAIENQFQGLISNVQAYKTESRKNVNKSFERFMTEFRDKNIDLTRGSTQIYSPKVNSFMHNLQTNSNSFEITELQNKVDALHFLDLQVQQIDRKANILIKRSKQTRKINFTEQSFEETENFVQSQQDEDMTPNGTYYGQLKKCKPSGKGVLKMHDTIVFQGRWLNGLYHGEGKQTNINYNSLNQSHYIRNIEQKIEIGLIALDNWKNYKGNFRFGKKNNKGVLILAGEFEVHGNFNKNFIIGQIKLLNKYNTLILTQILTKPILIR